MNKILIVEDEPNMRLGLKDNLEFEDYEVDLAEDGEVALTKIKNNSYDLILLDVMLPKVSGFEVCKRIRKERNQTPIILLTAKGEEANKVRGLELGADDYVTKPFSLMELLARIKAVLRRYENPTFTKKDEVVTIGKLEINFSTYNAQEDDKPVLMSHKEFEILHYLWVHKNDTVSRDGLLQDVWGYDEFPTTRTIDNFILKLRQKIEKDPTHPHIILTVHGIGYKLVN